ncbi:hypothetical protein [Streptomyces mexicanus]|uniref:Uncharacterized protein n=1 Tax=Streptomyces mexicanus TaxID=178566 RepID=A0A7X1LTC4_9ACTN|nr:hypothetical protein [Streptomyces mexicanus]MBC2868597.1 hypothetical protein [Streptomyces mexicanus]
MTQTVTITDEMPDEWVADVVAAVERRGWTVQDAHESAIIVQLGTRETAVLDADSGSVLVIGWTEQHGIDWGLSSDAGATVNEAQSMTEEAAPEAIAAAVDRLMLAGRPDAHLVQHAMPATAASAACTCETVQPCGGIITDAECPDHGARRAPQMWWHWEGPTCALA